MTVSSHYRLSILANAEFAEIVLPTCRKRGISFIPYSPLGRGLLSGKIKDAKVFKESTAVDYRAMLPQFQPDVLTDNLFLFKAITNPCQVSLVVIFCVKFEIQKISPRSYTLKKIFYSTQEIL